MGWAGSGSVCEFQSGHGGVSVQGTGAGRQIRGTFGLGEGAGVDSGAGKAFL